MRHLHPWKVILIGFVLVMFGFIAPFLMVLDIVESSFILCFLSHITSVGGLILGIVGTAMYGRLRNS